MQKRMTKKEAKRLRDEGKIVLWTPAIEVVIVGMLVFVLPTILFLAMDLLIPSSTEKDIFPMVFAAFMIYGMGIFLTVNEAITYYIIDRDGVTEQGVWHRQYLRWSDCKFVGRYMYLREDLTVLLTVPLSKDKYDNSADRKISREAYSYYSDKGISIGQNFLYDAGLTTPDIIALWEHYRERTDEEYRH